MGWRPSRALASGMAKEDEAAGRPYRWFSSDDLRWLVRLGYAEERVMRDVHVYRLTAAGATPTVLDWQSAVSGYGISGMARAEIFLPHREKSLGLPRFPRIITMPRSRSVPESVGGATCFKSRSFPTALLIPWSGCVSSTASTPHRRSLAET